jgi:predicted dehydrogenase
VRTHLQIGVLGLGRRWQRCLDALAKMHGRLEVRAVWDPISPRAIQTARSLRCAATEGVIELLERDNVQAALLLDPPWHGAWAALQASRLGKPVCCTFSTIARETNPGNVDALFEQPDQQTKPPAVYLASSLCGHPLVHHLRRLASEQLREVRVIQARVVRPKGRPTVQTLLPWLYLVQSFFDTSKGDNPSPPPAISVQAPPKTGLVTLLAEFADGRHAHLTVLQHPEAKRSCSVRLLGPGGVVSATWPRTLAWQDQAGTHRLRIEGQCPVRALLESFYHSVRTGEPRLPSLAEARTAFAWWRQLCNTLGTAHE